MCVVLQIHIVFTRGPPNKAVKKKAFFGPVFCALFKMQSLFLLKPLLSFRSAHVTWTAGLPCTGQLTRYQPTNCSRTEIQHLSDNFVKNNIFYEGHIACQNFILAGPHLLIFSADRET